MADPDNEMEDDMQAPEDGEEVDMANLRAMLRHFRVIFRATINLKKTH
jgi:uncharacterized protein (DUF305 family)